MKRLCDERAERTERADQAAIRDEWIGSIASVIPLQKLAHLASLLEIAVDVGLDHEKIRRFAREMRDHAAGLIDWPELIERRRIANDTPTEAERAEAQRRLHASPGILFVAHMASLTPTATMPLHGRRYECPQCGPTFDHEGTQHDSEQHARAYHQWPPT